DEEPQLSVHRVDGAAVRLERAELTKSAVDPLFAQERTEPRKSGHRGQRFVRGPEPDARWIWPADAVAPAGRALAAHDVSAHLRGARRVGGRCHAKRDNHPVGRFDPALASSSAGNRREAQAELMGALRRAEARSRKVAPRAPAEQPRRGAATAG